MAPPPSLIQMNAIDPNLLPSSPHSQSDYAEIPSSPSGANRVLTFKVPTSMSADYVSRVLENHHKAQARKRRRIATRRGIEADNVVIDEEEEATKPRREVSVAVMEEDQKVKLAQLVKYHRLHYARFFSVSNTEYFNMIRTHFGPLDVEDPLYKSLRTRLMSYTRGWQNRLIMNFEAHYQESCQTNILLRTATNEMDIAAHFRANFNIEHWYRLMEFIHGVVDYKAIEPDTPIYKFCLNTYAWFSVYVRRAQCEPATEGKIRSSPLSIFNRIKLVGRHPSFADIQISDFPLIKTKPESSRAPKAIGPASIIEAHPGFQILD